MADLDPGGTDAARTGHLIPLSAANHGCKAQCHERHHCGNPGERVRRLRFTYFACGRLFFRHDFISFPQRRAKTFGPRPAVRLASLAAPQRTMQSSGYSARPRSSLRGSAAPSSRPAVTLIACTTPSSDRSRRICPRDSRDRLTSAGKDSISNSFGSHW